MKVHLKLEVDIVGRYTRPPVTVDIVAEAQAPSTVPHGHPVDRHKHTII